MALEHSPKLLLIDDDPSMRLIITRKLLNHFAFEITEATGGDEGISRLQSSEFHLIICDHWMQNGSGDEVADFLHRRADIKAPIIFFSSDPDVIRHYMIRSSFSAILKPRLDELLSAIETLGFPRKSPKR